MPHWVATAVGIGVSVGVAGAEVSVEGGSGVVVGGESGVLVGDGFGVSVAGSGVEVGVTTTPAPPIASVRTIRGATHTARSPAGDPLESTVSMKLTFLPANELKSMSAG